MNKSYQSLLLFFILFNFSFSLFAQSVSMNEFNFQMGRYYKACLYMRDGAKLKSPQKYESAMRLIHKDSIMVSDFTPTAVDTLSEVPTEGHFVFTYSRAKQGRGEIYVDPGNLREEPTKFSREEGRCFIMHRALKANGKTTYSYKCAEGKSCLAVVCELKGEIELTVTSQNDLNISSKSYEYDAVGVAVPCSDTIIEINAKKLNGNETITNLFFASLKPSLITFIFIF